MYGGIVGSIYKNGSEYEVVVPEYDTWITIQNAGGGEQLSTVIWHESFHAYQNGYCRMEDTVDGKVLAETELAELIDNDSEKKNLYQKEMDILGELIREDNSCDAKEIAIKYKTVAEERDELLSDEEKRSEELYEMMEGSAYYVESKAVNYENGEAVYKKKYLDSATKCAEGNAKYYRHGMLECMLLDELDPEWKDSYSFDRTLDEVIAEYAAE